MSDYSCKCGKTQRNGSHPFDCETCPICGSTIIAAEEEFGEPMEHCPIERISDTGIPYKECKRCCNKL